MNRRNNYVYTVNSNKMPVINLSSDEQSDYDSQK